MEYGSPRHRFVAKGPRLAIAGESDLFPDGKAVLAWNEEGALFEIAVAR